MKEPVGRKMNKIAKMYQAQLQKELRHLDIDRSFYPLLLIESGNGITQQELATQLHSNKVQVVRIIDYLSSNGYVERVQNPADKRKYVLTITEKAALVMPDIHQVIKTTSNSAFEGLSESKIDELYEMLDIIENNLVSE